MKSSLCSDTIDRIIRINCKIKEQQDKIEKARRTGEISIKQFGLLIDVLDELKLKKQQLLQEL